MKKYSLLQVIIVGVTALACGFLSGIFIRSFSPNTVNLSGTIGKSDSFRNIKITEDDQALRNELVTDTSKTGQYQRHLLFYYKQSQVTYGEVAKALLKAEKVPGFEKTFNSYSLSFRSRGVEIEPARAEIMRTMNVLMSLKSNGNMPVIDFLNEAQNAIVQIRIYENLAANFARDIAAYIDDHPDKPDESLKQASEIIVNCLSTADLNYQGRPVLNYKGQKILLNDW